MRPLHETTQALHCEPADGSDAHSEPIWLTSAYDFDSAEQASDRFSNRTPGNVYSRFTNPSVSNFEHRLAIMEKAEDAVATASGMGAYLALGMAYLRQGDEVLLGTGLFGSTSHLFRQYFSQFGVTCRSLPLDDTVAWGRAISSNTRMLIVETPGNPTMKVADIRALANLARNRGALLVIDNTVLTPANQNPLMLGADLVLHSAGKFIDGQGRCVGGALVGSLARLAPIRAILRSGGMSMSPFNAWVFSKSLETLPARMQIHEMNTQFVCHWLNQQPAVERVYYTGMRGRPDTPLIELQQRGHGALISVDIKGGQDTAWRFINALDLITRCTNIGDAKTMVTHPWSTTHCKYPPQEKLDSGISPGLVRFSIGLEHYGDIIADMEQALAIAFGKEKITA